MYTRSVAQAIIEQLQQLETEYIFGLCGDALMGLLSELGKQDKITFIQTRHESAAGFMASAYAKLTGKMGVCISTSGPGMANLLNGLGDAYADKVPVLAITGQVPTDKIGTESKQYIDQQRFIDPLAAFSAQLTSPKALISLLSRAIQTAVKEKTVAHLSIPKDLFLQPCYEELVPPNPFLYENAPSETKNIAKAASFLSQCKKPMIIAGRGALGCSEEIKRTAEKLGAGIICSLGAKGVIAENYPQMLGGIGEGGNEEAMDMINKSDGLLTIGAMWYPENFMSSTIPVIQIEQQQNHIIFNKNLYTALLGNAKDILPSLISRLSCSPNTDWMNQIKEAKGRWMAELHQETGDTSVPISPARVIKELEQSIHAGAVIALDTGDHTVWFNRIFQTQNQELIFSGTWRTLGYGIPAAIAAQLLYPQKQVIALVGDGGFAMSMAELSTIMKYQLPVKIIIFNNSCLSMEKNKMVAVGLNPFGVDLVNPDFAKLGESFGIRSIRIQELEELTMAFHQLLDNDGPGLLDIVTSTKPAPLSKMKAVIAGG